MHQSFEIKTTKIDNSSAFHQKKNCDDITFFLWVGGNKHDSENID